MGQCPACREWNTFVEEPMAAKTPAGNQGIGSHSAAGRKPVHLTEISTGKEERIPTGIGELDRVLGGGIVPGSLTLVGGDPGWKIHTPSADVPHAVHSRTSGFIHFR